jgi:DNA-binding PadR family transcriptional regulator
MFDRGDLKFAVLRLIAERPMHGYEVMRALEDESRGTYRPSPGSVYPTLQMLEDEGFLRVNESSGNS